MHIGQCRTGFYYFQITPISKFGILIDKSVSFSQNKIFDVTWIFQKVQVQIRTELGDSQPVLTQSLVPVFKHPTGPTISLPYESSVGSMMQASAHKIEFPVTKVGEQSGKEVFLLCLKLENDRK